MLNSSSKSGRSEPAGSTCGDREYDALAGDLELGGVEVRLDIVFSRDFGVP